MTTTYQTNVIDTVQALPEFSSQVYHWLLTQGWYNFDGESGFSDVDAKDVADALSCKVLAVNAAIGHLIETGLVFTEPYENFGTKKVGRTFKNVVVDTFQIIYTNHNDDEPAHDDLLRYRDELSQERDAVINEPKKPDTNTAALDALHVARQQARDAVTAANVALASIEEAIASIEQ